MCKLWRFATYGKSLKHARRISKGIYLTRLMRFYVRILKLTPIKCVFQMLYAYI